MAKKIVKKDSKPIVLEPKRDYEFHVLCRSESDCDHTREKMKDEKFTHVRSVKRTIYRDHVAKKKLTNSEEANLEAKKLLKTVPQIETISVFEVLE